MSRDIENTPSILLVSQAKQIEVNILNGSSLRPLYQSQPELTRESYLLLTLGSTRICTSSGCRPAKFFLAHHESHVICYRSIKSYSPSLPELQLYELL